MTDNKKNVLVAVLIVGVVAMTVAFAALSTNLRISGTASVPNTNWNIHFANWALDTASTVTVGSNTQQNTASYPTVAQLQQSLAPNVTLVEGINVTLYQPNDYVKYTFNIVNEGTIDASLDNFTHTMTCESGKNCDFLEYTVECQDSQLNTVTNNYVLPHGQSVSCYLQLKFKDVNNVAKNNNQANNLQASVVNGVYTQEATSATLAANWSWIQKQVSQAQGGNSGGNEQQGISSPYTNLTEQDITWSSTTYGTKFDGNYTAYKWNDVEGTTPSQYDFSVETDEIGDNECPFGYAHYNGDGHESSCYLVDWYTSLNLNSKAYARTNGTTPEVCGVFSNGIVCMTSSNYNISYSNNNFYYSDFEDVPSNAYYDNITTVAGLQATGLKGYALSKAEEMLSKGADSCIVGGNIGGFARVGCHMSSSGCTISSSSNFGLVDCYNDIGGSVAIYDNESTD